MKGKSRVGSRVVAVRYARALLAVAVEKKLDLERVSQELGEVASLLDREERLKSVLSAPSLPEEKRVAILEQVFTGARLSQVVGNLLRVITENERMSLLREISDAFRDLVLEHLQVRPGEVVSAHPMSEEQQSRLARSMGEALGMRMVLRYRSDPGLVGGLVVRIGNRVYDASVTTQLRRFKEKALTSL